MSYDLLFTNVTIIDGSGSEGYQGSVAVKGDRIIAIGSRLSGGATITIDGTGKVLSPGFIDSHTHDDTNVIRFPEMLPKITQGVTTVIVGNCGISAAGATVRDTVPDPMNLLGNKEDFRYPTLAAYQAAVKQAQPAINVASLIGHITLRNNCMNDLFRSANQDEIKQMRLALRQGLKEGALGLSTGLAYATAFESSTAEVMDLAEELAGANGLYTTHLRSEFEPILQAMDEAFRIGRHAKVPVVLSHHKCAGAKNWGRTIETLGFLEKTRQSQDVCCDCYPYHASSSTLDIKQVTDEFDIIITWSDPHPEVAGQKLADIAAQWGQSMWEVAPQLMPAGAIYYNMAEEDVQRVLSYSHSMIGSDGLPNDPMPHPRLWGSFPRVLGHYSRELQLFPLKQAVHKMTGMTAARYQLHSRGVIKEGYFADLVLFDPQTVIDSASFTQPKVAAQGIEAVVVNGVLTYYNRKMTGDRAGCYLKRGVAI